MADNYAARAATAPELVKFRAPQQASFLGLAIHLPATVYTARINQSFTNGTDGIAALTYDGGSGTLADVLPGMEIWIGSAAGLRDKGVARIRKTPAATVFYIGQSSCAFADNDYLTVKKSFNLYQRDVRMQGGKAYMDYEIPFGSYTLGGCVPRVGPVAAVLKRVAGTVTFTPPTPADSACYDGATIVSYLYAFPGAASSGNLTSGTGTAYAVYTAAGQYLWSVTITDSAGRATVAYRWVFVDPAALDFQLTQNPVGDYSSGDWSFGVTVYTGALTTEIVDRALVALYSTDYYNGTAGSIGKLSGYENIRCVGWVDGESISYKSESGEVSFTVRGAAYWLSKLRAFPFELQDVSGVAANWKQIKQMTVDKALAHILMWTSTATMIMDCYFTGDTTRVKILTQPSGSLLGQINQMALNTIFAKTLVNNYGQMYVEIDTQIADSATRATIDTVMDFETQDYEDGIEIERVSSEKTAMLELGGSTAYNGTTASLVYSRAPGNNGFAYGDFKSQNNYIFADQTECNRIAGALLAMQNNEIEPLELALMNNPLIDICPRMYCTITTDAADNPRGVALTDANLIPRRVEYAWNGEGVMTTRATFEIETTGVSGVTYIPPKADVTPSYEIGDIGSDMAGLNTDFPSADLGGFFPPAVSESVTDDCSGSAGNVFNMTWDKGELNGNDSSKLIARAYFPCMVRSTGTQIEIRVSYFADAESNFTAYAIKGGARVLTASSIGFSSSVVIDPNGQTGTITIDFIPLTNTEVDGFEIELAAGIGSPVAYVAENEYTSGSINSRALHRANITIPANTLLSLEGVGYWTWVAGGNAKSYYVNLWASDSYVDHTHGTRLVINSDTSGSLDIINEAVGSNTRTFFNSGAYSSVWIFTNDGMYSDNATTNSGSIEYIIRYARADGRKIILGNTNLENVCAIGT